MCETIEEFSKYKKRYEEFINNLKLKIQYLNGTDDEFLKMVFLESVLVDVRAMLIETKDLKKNYTVQNNFRRFAKIPKGYIPKNNNLELVAQEIDSYLDSKVFGEGLILENLTIRNAIKFYVDKYIAHHDFVNEEHDIRKEKLKNLFLKHEIFSISNIVYNILNFAEDSSERIINATLESLTAAPDSSILTKSEDI